MKYRILKKQNQNNSGVVLLLSLLVTVFLSVLLGAAMLRANVQVQEVIQRQRFQQAFYAAETGIDFAIFNLRQGGAWKPGKGNIPAIVDAPLTVAAGATPIGFYSITVEDAAEFQGWESRTITSIGRDADGVIARTIQARVIVESPTKFLISTLGSLRMTSGSIYNADLLAKDAYFDIYSTSDPTIQVNGNVYYTNKVYNAGNLADPNNPVKLGAGKKLINFPTITFAGVDLDRYESLAKAQMAVNQGYFHNGNLPINLANLSAFNQDPNNTSFKPQIIYAKGDITISGQYHDSILIVASGNIYIEDDIIADPYPEKRPQIGLFAKGNVIIPQSTTSNGELDIEAFVLSEGTFTAEGNQYSKGTLNFTGSISVGGNNTTGVNLNAFGTRNYNFNPELSKNRTIPFTPFIVNIVLWQEI